jgi:hypothetical protein
MTDREHREIRDVLRPGDGDPGGGTCSLGARYVTRVIAAFTALWGNLMPAHRQWRRHSHGRSPGGDLMEPGNLGLVSLTRYPGRAASRSERALAQAVER